MIDTKEFRLPCSWEAAVDSETEYWDRIDKENREQEARRARESDPSWQIARLQATVSAMFTCIIAGLAVLVSDHLADVWITHGVNKTLAQIVAFAAVVAFVYWACRRADRPFN